MFTNAQPSPLLSGTVNNPAVDVLLRFLRRVRERVQLLKPPKLTRPSLDTVVDIPCLLLVIKAKAYKGKISTS